jgi:hypothetical protein
MYVHKLYLRQLHYKSRNEILKIYIFLISSDPALQIPSATRASHADLHQI